MVNEPQVDTKLQSGIRPVGRLYVNNGILYVEFLAAALREIRRALSGG
jgi:hypothetical protein